MEIGRVAFYCWISFSKNYMVVVVIAIIMFLVEYERNINIS